MTWTAQILWSHDQSYQDLCFAEKCRVSNYGLTKFSAYMFVSIDCFLYLSSDFCAVSSYKDRR